MKEFVVHFTFNSTVIYAFEKRINRVRFDLINDLSIISFVKFLYLYLATSRISTHEENCVNEAE